MADSDGPLRVSSDHERRYPGASKSATEVVINLARASSLVTTELTRGLRKHGLTPATFNVLMILEGDPRPLCPWEIGERLLVTRGTVTGLLDSLEKKTLIRRVPNPDDRRSLRIELTDKARTLLKRVWADHFPAEASMLSGLAKRDREELIRLLGKLQKTLA